MTTTIHTAPADHEHDAPCLPSARDLGISARHRRALMRESEFRFLMKLARDVAREAQAVRAVEQIGDTRLEIVGGEPAADALRQSLHRQSARYWQRAASYLRYRASGVSARDAQTLARTCGIPQ